MVHMTELPLCVVYLLYTVGRLVQYCVVYLLYTVGRLVQYCKCSYSAMLCYALKRM